MNATIMKNNEPRGVFGREDTNYFRNRTKVSFLRAGMQAAASKASPNIAKVEGSGVGRVRLAIELVTELTPPLAAPVVELWWCR